MRIKLMIGAGALGLALMAGCGGDATNGNANSANTMNSNTRTSVETTAPSATTPAGEFTTTTTEEAGVQTETRTYTNDPYISKVVITTRANKRTARVTSKSGEERELKVENLDDVLAKSGHEIGNAAGFVGDKAEDVGGKAVDVGKATVNKGKEVGNEVADKTEDVVVGAGNRAKKVGEKTVEGAKAVGNKTVNGAKKVGGAVKDAITP